ncbi:hypothetical protein GOP47_0018912 [Adiantum capillus-veneris]|uniref:Uncharacterized protein n=1 Tax=Adiantum capillus-veneris TaxID=13818 RepID=A0A9D4UF15_ADICA|nr:hypothetical protein GOP47_0018912 [Adiantum capillus-veneris]
MASPALILSEPQIDELHSDRAMDHSFERACLDDQTSENNGFENAGVFSERDACMENGDRQRHEEAGFGGCDGDHEHLAWTEHSAGTASTEALFEEDEAEGEVQSADPSAVSRPALKKTVRRKSFGGVASFRVVSPPAIVRTAKPSISSKLTSAPRNKHVTPCSLDPNHSHHHRSPPVSISLYRNFLKSSSPAALARRGESEHGDDVASPSSSNTPKRRHSLGAPSTGLSSSLDTPSSKRASLGSKASPASKFTKSASPRVDTRRASYSGPILSKSISGLSRSPSLKGSLQSPRGSSPRPVTPDSAKRRSPSTASTRSISKPASPRTPTASFSSPHARSSPSNGLTSTPSGRKKSTPIFTKNIKSISSSVDSPDNISRRKSLTSESRDPRFIALPSVDVKAGDDVRLDLRGQKVRSLDCNLVNLTPKMEFVYLRDNKLANLAGIEILRRVKVLDLSFNEFKGPGFEPLANCKALQQLYLAGNQITSLSGLPQLPNLEFLSVAQNKLKSLAMAPQPRLQVLAASKNKISTFKGFPHLPMLEHLRLEENPISEMQHVEAAAILLAGPTLKKFNDKDLPFEEQELARMYPAHTALCIRDGWEFCDVQEAFDSSMKFLTAQWAEKIPPGYTVEQALIEQPSEEDPCSCHFTFTKQSVELEDVEMTLCYQWFLGGRTPSNFVPIQGATEEVYWPKHEDVGRCLKVECTPLLGATEYPPIFAVSFPVLPGSGCPKVMSLEVDGELREGSLIKGHAEIAWCGGTPSKGIVSWLRRYENRSPVVIVGAEELDYQLSVDDVGANLLLMYTPVTQEGVKGEPHFATTAVVQAAPPSVSSVQILGDVEEGNTIKGVGTYFGGQEGSSKFDWLREDIESGEFKLVARGTSEYTLSQDDVGLQIMFMYTPVNLEGIHGDPVSAISGKVTLAPPKVTELRIVGDIREGNKIAISAIVSGGVEGASRVQWFKTSIPDESLGDANLEAISTAKISKAFRIPLGAVGFYLAAKYIPVRSDGESGEPVLIFSDAPVEMLPPSLSFISITGDCVEGEMLTASYGYVGGHEGSSQYSWYLHKNERDPGMPIPESAGLLQYKITKEAVNQFISFKCIPVRNDGVIGEAGTVFGQESIRPGSPKLLSLKIIGDPTEGAEMMLDKTYWGGMEGPSRTQWFRASPDGTQREIKGATGDRYTCQTEDLDAFLCVSYEPVRSDGARGPVVVSEPIGPVLAASPACRFLRLEGEPTEGKTLSFVADYRGGEKGVCMHEWIRLGMHGSETILSSEETLTLMLEDVGCRIKLVFTPVRKDGVTGAPQIIVSDTVVDADPVGLNLVMPECCEDIEVIPEKGYFGGIEGDSDFTWFRLHRKLQGFNLPDDAEILGYFNTYIPTIKDVGTFLATRWIPTRQDGKEGRPCYACSNTRVAAAPPSVSNVIIKEASPGTFIGEGVYYGGFEGESQMSWYRQKDDGSRSLITGANTKSYIITNDDYTCSLIFGYTPVRQDGVFGKLVTSDPTYKILPEIPRIQKLVLTGKAVEGEVLTALEVMPKSEKQQHVWEKYKKEVRYHWSRSTAPGTMDSFELLPSRGCSYKIRTEDIGHYIHCECIVTDVFDRSSTPATVLSAIIAPGMPKVTKLEIEGQGYHTNTYTVRGFYSGGKEGQSTIQWFRAMAGSPDLIPIAGEVGRTYEANVDDVAYRLVAVYTPVREDGTEGAPVSSSTEPIAVDPEIAKEVKQKIELGVVKFEALRDRDRSPLKVTHQQGLGNLERRVLDVNRKRVKVMKPGSKTSFPSTEIRGTYAPPFHMEVFRNDPHRFKIVIDSDNEVDLMVQNRHLRDVIVLVIRGLAQRFNSTPLNLLLKM